MLGVDSSSNILEGPQPHGNHFVKNVRVPLFRLICDNAGQPFQGGVEVCVFRGSGNLGHHNEQFFLFDFIELQYLGEISLLLGSLSLPRLLFL